jgi:hypothetical protein
MTNRASALGRLWPAVKFNVNQHMQSLRIFIGGLAREELLVKLREEEIRLNDFAKAFIANDRFKVSREAYQIDVEIRSLADLGLGKGGTYSQVMTSAQAIGLHCCPPETGPHLRLQLLDQVEDQTVDTRAERGAPFGSITVASNPLTEDEQFPRGLYLRRCNGSLWLRGYTSWPGHIWRSEDVFAFCSTPNAS